MLASQAKNAVDNLQEPRVVCPFVSFHCFLQRGASTSTSTGQGKGSLQQRPQILVAHMERGAQVIPSKEELEKLVSDLNAEASKHVMCRR